MNQPPVATQPPPPTATSARQSALGTEPPNDSWTDLMVRIAQFARHPKLELPKPTGGVPGTVGFIFRMLSVDLLLRLGTIPLVLFGTWLLKGAEYTALDVPEGSEINKLAIFILAAVVAPLLEEASMRLQIHRWSEWRFWLSTLVWSLFVGVSAWGTTGILWVPAVFPALLILWRLSAVIRGRTADTWNGHPGIVLWFVTIGFGLMHLSNYDIPVDNWRVMAAVLLVVPQILGGLLMAYTRVRVGYWGSVAHHAIGNGLLIALVLPTL